MPITWGVTAAGKRMPLDAEWEDVGVPGKTWVFEGESDRVRLYEPLFDTAVTEHWTVHWATCRHADQHRSR
jgi:hypothetical protein